MAEPFDTLAASVADILASFHTGAITQAQAATLLAPVLELIHDGEFAGKVDAVVGVLGRISGLIPVEVPSGSDRPSNLIGAPGAYAWDPVTKTFYGPKHPTAGWDAGVSMTEGPAGPAPLMQATETHVQWSVPGSGVWTNLYPLSAVSGKQIEMDATSTHLRWRRAGEAWVNVIARADLISPMPVVSVGAVSALPAGSTPEVTQTGTAAAPIYNFKLTTGNTGAVPNLTAAITMIANGQPATVTRSGPDTAPVLTLALPSPLDGVDAKQLEVQVNATHAQWRRVGETVWQNWFELALVTGAKGDRGEAFEFDAKPADLAARDDYDAEDEGFTVLVLDTGTVYARVGAVAGVWSDGFPFGQTQNALLQALSELDSSTGVLVQTGAETFAKRAIGAAADTQILDRLSADGRYRKQTDAVAMSSVTGLGDALDEKANAAAVLASLGDKADKADTYTKTATDDLLGAKADLVGGKVPLAQLPDIGGGDVESVAGLTGVISAWDLGGALGLRSDFGQQAISLARLVGQVQGMARGLADDFQTDTGVDAAASTNEYRTAAHSYVGRVFTAVANNMASDAAPSPQLASASSVYGGFEAFKAFDSSTTSYWCAETTAAAPTAWLQRRLASAVTISSYALKAPANVTADGYPISWTLQGSNNGSTWVNLDQRAAQTFANNEVKTYAVAAGAAYLYYRLQLSAASQYGGVADLTFNVATVQDLSLRSVAYTATATPSKAMLTVRAKGSGALTPGTDLRGYVSRDGGTTWTEATLVAGITTGGFTTFEAVEIDLSAQPTDTSMKWRVDATATKAPEIDAVVLQWSAS